MSDEYAYIGIKKCGCVVAAAVDSPDRPKDVAKDVAGFIRDGLTIERVSVEEVRERFNDCQCDEKPVAAAAPRSDQMEFAAEGGSNE